MKNLTITNRILILLSIIGVSLIIVLTALYFIQSRQEKLLYQETMSQFQNEVNSIRKLKSSTLDQITYDYTYWDEFVDLLQTRDSTWFANNISTILTSFHVDHVCVFDTLNNLIHEASSSNLTFTDYLTPEILKKLYAEKFIHFLALFEGEILEISGATIHRETDPDHTLTLPAGYFFIAKKWDEAYFQEIETLSNSEIILSKNPDEEIMPNQFIIRVVINLTGWDNKPIARLIFSKELTSLRRYNHQSVYMSVLVVGSFLIVFLTFYLLTRKLIKIPLTLVTNILKSEDPLLIEKLRNSYGEFKMIGQLFSDFIDQKKQLVITKEKAEESDRLKSAFLANMSHEIRTPMNGILGFADLLKEPDLTGEEQQKFVSIIENSGQRMLNIINDLIDISKIEARQVSLNNSATNIIELLNNLYSFFKPEMEKKGLEFIFRIKPDTDPIIVNTDKEKLYAILTNLLKNAIKYTPRGSVELGYQKTEETMHASSQITFFVKDTGIGIPKDRQQAIFDRFVQADIEDKLAKEGAGLGLAISKAYAGMMGGNIRVDSDGNAGSIFWVTIPVLDVKGPEDNPIARDEKVKSESHHLKDLMVLIAEDEVTSDFYLTEILKKECKEIFHTTTGKKTVELMKKNPEIQIILMDIKMPDMNGYEATRQIRQFNKDVVIIAQTAYALSGDREKALDAGCNDYIAKPVKKVELFPLIHKYYDQK